ncbi:transmembrane transporter [Schizosaccharomyces osmophilus]|uniref:Transmembrane transporter n=1 Tax=Schizosaccharomyces osmophilus TaxID=2545709 RepID=A0AAE9W8L1_9SCHI|nr:transmembrane transporter [Schizosaccharomyces osmophilus]WBW70836.1 transmembrane transporter [Schizosaccharomyces osmophilus]
MDLLYLAVGKTFQKNNAMLHKNTKEGIVGDNTLGLDNRSSLFSGQDKVQWILETMRSEKSIDVTRTKISEGTPQEYLIVIELFLVTTAVTFPSDVYSTGVPEIFKSMHTSTPVASLSTCTFLVGFAMGSLPFAPLSSIYGRLLVYLVFIFTIFQIGGGSAHNIWTTLIIQYFQVVFGSIPSVNGGGGVSDMARYLREVTGNPLWYTNSEKQRDPRRAVRQSSMVFRFIEVGVGIAIAVSLTPKLFITII